MPDQQCQDEHLYRTGRCVDDRCSCSSTGLSFGWNSVSGYDTSLKAGPQRLSRAGVSVGANTLAKKVVTHHLARALLRPRARSLNSQTSHAVNSWLRVPERSSKGLGRRDLSNPQTGLDCEAGERCTVLFNRCTCQEAWFVRRRRWC